MKLNINLLSGSLTQTFYSYPNMQMQRHLKCMFCKILAVRFFLLQKFSFFFLTLRHFVYAIQSNRVGTIKTVRTIKKTRKGN